MEAIHAIFNRRSIRKFTGAPISGSQTELLLKSAMQAPSARNKQPWHFYVIKKREMLNHLCEVHPYGKMLAEASLAIVICGDKRIEDSESYILQDCSAATQNMLLAAHASGLGSVWLGIHPREDRIQAIRETLNLPENIFPVSMIAIGLPAEEKMPEDRYLADRVYYIE